MGIWESENISAADNLTEAQVTALTTGTNADGQHNHAKLIPASDSTTAIQLTKADGTTSVVNVDTTNSRIGIGTISPVAKMHISNSTVLPGGATYGHLFLESSDSMDINKGGTLYLGGSFTGTSTTTFATIAGLKENNIDNNYAGFLSFYTRPNGSIASEKMRITSTGNVGIGTTSPTTKLQVTGDITPSVADLYDIGSSTLQWDDIYATNATIQTSDARLKEDVVDLYISSAFLEKLRPVSFKWKDYVIPEETTVNDVHAKDENGNLLYETITETDVDGNTTTRQEPVIAKETVVVRPEIVKTHVRKHCGLIAQEVEQAILDIGMTTEDFAALCYDSETDRYSVRYTELIPVLIRGWQDQQAKIKDLETRLIALELK